MTPGPRRDVAVLGGGMAGLAAAWRLSDPAHAGQVGKVTVFQRGWRLGGKGASSRGVHGRIEEHGLHVWLGYYDNAFRLVRECYDELDRPRTDPGCPIRTWRDAFAPAPHIGLAAGDDERWMAWFSTDEGEPGDPEIRTAPPSLGELLTRGLRLLADFAASLEGPAPVGRVVLSARPTPPAGPSPGWGPAVRQLANVAAAAALELASLGSGLLGAAALQPVAGPGAPLGAARDQLRRLVGEDRARLRWFELVDLVVTSLRGVVADGLLADPRGLRAIDDEEFRDWLVRHGVAPETLRSPLVTGVYDLAFASAEGDPADTRFAAGTGLYMSALMYFGYRGSMFWKMQAGMGDVVFAPLYQALRDRGVAFEFFARVDDVVPGEGGSIEEIHLTRQAEVAAPGYEPLVDHDGLPCFPAAPDDAQLGGTDPRRLAAAETLWDDSDGSPWRLRRGEDFDDVVVAMSVGILPHTCGRLVAADERWARMVERVGTVATQSFQLWLRAGEAELGLPGGGVTVTGGSKPFDTVSSMSHLLDVEQWPTEDRPRSVLYFCSTLATPGAPGPGPSDYPARQDDRVRTHAVEHLDRAASPLLPEASTAAGFHWDLLCGDGDRAGADRFDSQFWTANVDPSDRYVQALPGSGRFRIRPDESGWDNLALAGDWTDCGLNVGCIEAATVSGLQAANAVLGRTRWDGISGYWEPLERA